MRTFWLVFAMCISGLAGAQSLVDVQAKLDKLRQERANLAVVRDYYSQLGGLLAKGYMIVPIGNSMAVLSREQFAAALAAKVLTGEKTPAKAQELAILAGKLTKGMQKDLQDEISSTDKGLAAMDREIAKLVAERDKLLDKTGQGGGFKLQGHTMDKTGALFVDKWSDYDGTNVVFDSPWGKATYTIKMPATIDDDGETLTLEIDARAAARERFVPYMRAQTDLNVSATPEVAVDVSNGEQKKVTVPVTISLRKGSEAKEIIITVGIQSGPQLRFRYTKG